jgi:hypothetical protein
VRRPRLGLLRLGRGSGERLSSRKPSGRLDEAIWLVSTVVEERTNSTRPANLCWGKLLLEAKLVVEPPRHQNYKVTAAAGNLQIRILDLYISALSNAPGFLAGTWDTGPRTISGYLWQMAILLICWPASGEC